MSEIITLPFQKWWLGEIKEALQPQGAKHINIKVGTRHKIQSFPTESGELLEAGLKYIKIGEKQKGAEANLLSRRYCLKQSITFDPSSPPAEHLQKILLAHMGG